LAENKIKTECINVSEYNGKYSQRQFNSTFNQISIKPVEISEEIFAAINSSLGHTLLSSDTFLYMINLEGHLEITISLRTHVTA
jgi:hypothetical protein